MKHNQSKERREPMDKFLEWCDDKAQVIIAVVLITVISMAVMPDKIDLNIVYGGLFGLATGMAIAKK